eukprot:3740972-Amphidinium_carterae.1
MESIVPIIWGGSCIVEPSFGARPNSNPDASERLTHTHTYIFETRRTSWARIAKDSKRPKTWYSKPRPCPGGIRGLATRPAHLYMFITGTVGLLWDELSQACCCSDESGCCTLCRRNSSEVSHTSCSRQVKFRALKESKPRRTAPTPRDLFPRNASVHHI